jgi:hypothetical protein
MVPKKMILPDIVYYSLSAGITLYFSSGGALSVLALEHGL